MTQKTPRGREDSDCFALAPVFGRRCLVVRGVKEVFDSPSPPGVTFRAFALKEKIKRGGEMDLPRALGLENGNLRR